MFICLCFLPLLMWLFAWNDRLTFLIFALHKRSAKEERREDELTITVVDDMCQFYIIETKTNSLANDVLVHRIICLNSPGLLEKACKIKTLYQQIKDMSTPFKYLYMRKTLCVHHTEQFQIYLLFEKNREVRKDTDSEGETLMISIIDLIVVRWVWEWQQKEFSRAHKPQARGRGLWVLSIPDPLTLQWWQDFIPHF